MTTKRVRLLNPSIYSDNTHHENGRDKSSGFYSPINDLSLYPVVVDATELSYAKTHVEVSASELDRAFPYRPEHLAEIKHSFSLNWTNSPFREDIPAKSWEEVSPFDFWNELKRSREVGEKPRKGYL